jgi:hypothetical protein
MAKSVGIRIRVERNLRDAFAQACRDNGSTSSEVIRQLMQEYVEKNYSSRQLDLFEGLTKTATSSAKE